MLYIYRRAVSDGARELEDCLNDIGVPARRTQGKLLRERFRPDRDKLVCWGDHWPGVTNALNNVEPIAKFTEAQRIAAAGVATVEVSRTRPATGPASRGYLDLGDGMFHLDEAEARRLLQQIQAYLDAPLPPAAEWLPRRNNHIGGLDLLRPGNADYYSKKVEIVEEYRVHSFLGKSIRAGVKVHREGVNAHPWIRSYDGGWRIAYENFKSTKAMRELAAKAVEALGLQFGAVDLGKRADGTLLVLEVNRAPGIEGGSAERYAEAIASWVRGE